MDYCIDIHTPYEAPINVHVKRCHVSVINPFPTYVFRSCGRNHVAREPHAKVMFRTNRGHESGYARIADLPRAGAAASLIRARAMQRAVEALSPEESMAMRRALDAEIARRQRLGIT